jgi:hypothetical protein
MHVPGDTLEQRTTTVGGAAQNVEAKIIDPVSGAIDRLSWLRYLVPRCLRTSAFTTILASIRDRSLADACRARILNGRITRYSGLGRPAGRTASKTLLDQLCVLDTSLKDSGEKRFCGDAEALLINGQFLQNKFSEKLAFRP